MRKLIPLKFVSGLLLLVMMIVTVQGVHESAHAMQGSITSLNGSVMNQADLASSDQNPCGQSSEHQDYDACDACINCECHAPLTASQLAPHYSPMISSLRFSGPYQYLPEVFLSKFIPPQNLA
ncbi:hypothetical protein FO488_12320 [Geobacter sp. FeAm09]|uniref:hypothetical protein n=1 Tax=Geobacter sp. FeAm09 TaxID=2597769 RepID=UPI0011F07B7E|nr:hypothetical protein [Geobacter sp. FeAm09]QEM68863.1 hypothetical protein FO488_12320 [Geobacter sp. FeAm09]